MLSRVLIRRILLTRPATTPSSTRFFTRHTTLPYKARPQLPFLSIPLTRNQQFRYLTTERKRWLVYEVVRSVQYTGYIWGFMICTLGIYWALQQEWLERRYPSPHEWKFLTRLRFRLLMWAPDRNDSPQTDWVEIGEYAKNVLSRLEDPNIEGAGLQDLTEGGVWIEGIGKSGYDITAKSEPWRRGYYEVLMMSAQAAEHLDNMVVDIARRFVFPKEQVLGPSNPNPQPIPPGAPPAPHEEDVERFYEPPEIFYMRILTTKGFTTKQKMDAALDYAAWLDFKEVPKAAERMYEWALQISTENTLPKELPLGPQSLVLQERGRKPTENLLKSLTAFAVHKARNEEIFTALPILISILRARRSLPQSKSAPAGIEEEHHKSPWTFGNAFNTIKNFIAEPPYPPPPGDGESPPIRDAQELCEEAGLNLYIGEIIYASKANSSGREDGLAWTREAVDMAEEQLHKLVSGAKDKQAEKTCKHCLNTGLENWSMMVARLVREEQEKQENASPKSSWLGFWGNGQVQSETGRWAAEENIVKERTRRAQEVLDELQAPKAGFWSLFFA